jgi:hypothetical protein
MTVLSRYSFTDKRNGETVAGVAIRTFKLSRDGQAILAHGMDRCTEPGMPRQGMPLRNSTRCCDKHIEHAGALAPVSPNAAF